MLAAAEEKLKGLGPERSSRAAQAAYLTELSTKFQHLVDLTLSANFGTDSLFEEYKELKIAPAVVLRMEQFGKEMTQWGHKYSFDASKQHEDEAFDLKIGERKTNHNRARYVPTTEFQVRKHTTLNDLEDLLYSQTSLSCSSGEGTDEWLRQLHKNSRGFELGTFDPVILASAMRTQTSKWRPITFGYVSDIAVITHVFIKTALSCICANDRLQGDLYNFLVDDLRTRYTKAMEQVRFILAVELDGTPMTENHYFIDQLEERYGKPMTRQESLH